MEDANVFVALGQLFLSLFATTVKWLNQKSKKQRTLRILIREAANAALAAALVYLLYMWLNLNVYLAFALSAIVGQAGSKGVELISKIIVKLAASKINIDLTEPTEPEEGKK